ncbi:MATE family efflux transporter [Tundrisphaera lichenicola]|uniref:MATE family efflux transporter n=1 Tax=Tundrisphaera lichenicola TaxID=2029860 RepID=UPI003EBA8870
MSTNLREFDSTRPVEGTARLIKELGPMLRLAGPVVVAELGWMAMGIVDTIVVGPLGAEATGAVGLGSNLYIASAIFGIGLLLGLDTLVSQEHGAGREDDARRSLAQGVYLAAAMTPLTMLLILGVITLLPRMGILDEVIRLTVPYLEALAWGTGPLLLFAAFRRYLQGVGVVKPITFALVTANLINAAGCWVLVHGKFGLPRMGVEGAGWTTCLSRAYLLAVGVGAFAIYGPLSRSGRNPFRDWPRPEWSRLRALIALGLPAAIQVTLEVGVFATATTLAGRLDAASLASHNIVLNISSLTYMVPLGIASAGAVRVGQAIGRGDEKAASNSGWTALLIGAVFMTLSGLSLLTMARPIIGIFTGDARVIETTARLFYLAAAFQLFDGIQVVATGVLRGAGDTRTSMACNLLAHWGIGLPIGYALAFWLDYGVVGLWVGLSIGLCLAGLGNLTFWARTARKLREGKVKRIED